MSDGYVYFAQSFDGGPIKIGFSENPAGRVSALSTSSPSPLDLLAVIPGDEGTEKELHAIFADHRLHGEWFADGAPALCELIEAIVAPDRSNDLHRELHDLIEALERTRMDAAA